ncbi:MAG TPA: ABC transporter permease, partial [Bryobacteraceae bacterium]|nr:ABC transporter permease [Bryobacteraceae bacterium]
MLIVRYLSDFRLAGSNLWAQKTRTVLTALGIIFGVGAVIGMLAIGAGAREESMKFIEQLGVRNVLIEARPATSTQEFQQRRRSSPGLTERDVRILTGNVDSLDLISARRSMHPVRVFPKPDGDLPELYGVRQSYAAIHNWKLAEGAAFPEAADAASEAVCVLGEKARVATLGYGPAIGKFVKVNDTWLRVIGVLREQVSSGSGTAQSVDPNFVIYIPLNTYRYRFFDPGDNFKDELDGVDIRLKVGADSMSAARVVTAILESTHHATPDFTVTIPAELL